MVIQSEIGFTIGCGRHTRMRISLRMEQGWLLWLVADGYNLQAEVQIKSRPEDMRLIFTKITAATTDP